LRSQNGPGSDTSTRERILIAWYSRRLKEEIAPLIAKWKATIGLQVAEWGVKQMKTRWGTCNIEARRIWLNLELIKKPVHCLEYIIVHEIIHLLELYWLLETSVPLRASMMALPAPSLRHLCIRQMVIRFPV
jgi:predicted metal-dependent hydrolase